MAPDRDMTPHRDALLELDPELDIEIWPGVENPGRVTFIVAWNHNPGELNRFPNLKVVASLGAGVEHLMSDNSIPRHVAITRLITPSIRTQIAEYLESVCYQILRRSREYFLQQEKAYWNRLPHAVKKERQVGILGLGELGGYTAEKLAANGWNVSGWSRSKKSIAGCRTYAGSDELDTFLGQVQILLNLLPLTPQTEGILDLELFKKLKRPAWIVNTGRGEHLVDEDLIYAIDKGVLSGAVLDVFREEPLPGSHPFWSRPSITITPHVGSLTWPEDLAGQLLDNYTRMLSGLPLLHTVDRKRGY